MSTYNNVVTFEDTAEQSQYCIMFHERDGQDIYHYLMSTMFVKIIPNF